MKPKLNVVVSGYEYKIDHKASWIKIFYQHLTKIEDGFSSFDQAQSYQDSTKYSILS